MGLTGAIMRKNPIATAIRFWSVAKGLSVAQIQQAMARPVSLAAVGSPQDQDRLIALLSREPGAAGAPALIGDRVIRATTPDDARAAGAVVVLDAGAANRPDAGFIAYLSEIAAKHADLRLALAASFPAFRPIVIGQLIAESSKENARVAALSALPGVIPLTDWLVPATAAGDMYILTKNQVTLLLQVAACYGLPPDLKARLRELLPVVGGAFGWRAVARELIGLVPGGVGVIVKASLAYAGTVAVGRAAAYYYASGGHTLSAADMRRLYRESLSEATRRVRALLPFRRR
ncbi:MAG TPA: hypothetical protein VFW40_09905 [Capsulimonadaceae bacterium]|nr:hypothetical protein [Capsulimonadaceae bacterium]